MQRYVLNSHPDFMFQCFKQVQKQAPTAQHPCDNIDFLKAESLQWLRFQITDP